MKITIENDIWLEVGMTFDKCSAGIVLTILSGSVATSYHLMYIEIVDGKLSIQVSEKFRRKEENRWTKDDRSGWRCDASR